MTPIQPCGGNSTTESFITKMAQTILEKQSDIQTSDTRTEEYNMPVDKIAGLSAILGEGKYIREIDSAKAFQMVLNSSK
jgi:hypothetical protein